MDIQDRIKKILNQVDSWSESNDLALALKTETGISSHQMGVEVTGVTCRSENKAGKLAWFGMLGNTKVKVYQTFSTAQTDFIQKLSSDTALRFYFPRVINGHGAYLAAEWIEGNPLTVRDLVRNPQWLGEVARMQAILHKYYLPAVDCGFDYLDFLIGRVKRFLEPFEIPKSLSAMIETATNECPDENKVSHADVTPRNIVLDRRDGSLKLIDNELLSQGGYYFLDLFNTLIALSQAPSLQIEYLRAYRREGGNPQSLLEHEHFYRAAWGLRVVGSLLSSGQLAYALQEAENCMGAGFPNLITLINEIESS